MEVPPFQRPKPTLLHYPTRSQKSGGQRSARNIIIVGHGEMGGVTKGYARRKPRAWLLLCDAPCWRWKWGAPTRLETRTKESNRRAREEIWLPVLLSYWKGDAKCICGVHTSNLFFWFAQHRPALRGLRWSVPVWTRKVVNYAWTRWSPGKPRWRPVAMLTCKSLVWFGYRSERLIEPPSSWFTSKFPSG